MSLDSVLTVRNGQAFATASQEPLPLDQFRREVLESVARGGRVAAFFARREQEERCRLNAVIAVDAESLLQVFSTVAEREYPSLTPECPQLHWFEREVCEQTGLVPVGHPWLTPIRFSGAEQAVCGVTDFFQMSGDEVHEVAVGPVHAGIIEPGHFRFQCHGETVYHLEISLGYQHRGVERALIGGPNQRTIHYLQTLAGDTTAGHTLAYCWAVEALSQTHVPPRAQALRGVALELERLANHVGDLGALAGDVGYLPTMSYCGRIRGDVLNLTAMLCGNRFSRGLIQPGGVAYDVDPATVLALHRRLQAVAKDARVAIELLWNSPSVMARFEGTGVVPRAWCDQVGLVGVAARACGVARDVRRDFPAGIYRFVHVPEATYRTGDVFARAYVRWLEIQRSLTFVEEQLSSLPAGSIRQTPKPLRPEHSVVSLAEGWRGEICHVASTDAEGRFAAYKVVDPSFHNWFGLALALRNQQISDFPLCNKSFNLSYCGHDL
ncbi:MAG: NADH-quinone oxidoreductase subunit C [Pirellulaceae bacterium]|nr:NADH-quinone oxidoreductase subunit C [Pirellulaceae bacterium]